MYIVLSLFIMFVFVCFSVVWPNLIWPQSVHNRWGVLWLVDWLSHPIPSFQGLVEVVCVNSKSPFNSQIGYMTKSATSWSSTTDHLRQVVEWSNCQFTSMLKKKKIKILQSSFKDHEFPLFWFLFLTTGMGIIWFSKSVVQIFSEAYTFLQSHN